MLNIVELIISLRISSKGLAVDWIGRNLYWTDTETRQIEVFDLDGGWRMVLLSDDLVAARGIAVDPRVGLVLF